MTDKTREAFEAWEKTRHGYGKDTLTPYSYDASTYELPLVAARWEAWQAARAQPAQAVPLLSDEDVLRAAARTLDSEVVEVSPLSCIKDFARAIEQAVRAKMGKEGAPMPEKKT